MFALCMHYVCIDTLFNWTPYDVTVVKGYMRLNLGSPTHILLQIITK